MNYFKLNYFFVVLFLLYGCSNPYPYSNTVDVGPPISLEVDKALNEENLSEEVVEEVVVEEENLMPGINVEKIDDFTIHASWDLDEGKGVILPPVELISVIKKECNNKSSGHLLTFSVDVGIVNAVFKCW